MHSRGLIFNSSLKYIVQTFFHFFLLEYSLQQLFIVKRTTAGQPLLLKHLNYERHVLRIVPSSAGDTKMYKNHSSLKDIHTYGGEKKKHFNLMQTDRTHPWQPTSLKSYPHFTKKTEAPSELVQGQTVCK